LQAAEFTSGMVAHDHASRTHGKVVICKNHTPVSTPTFVFDAMNKVLLETVLQNLNEMVRIDFCCVVIVFVTFRSSRLSNETTNPTQHSSLRSREGSMQSPSPSNTVNTPRWSSTDTSFAMSALYGTFSPIEFLICLHSNAINILFLTPSNASLIDPFFGILFFAVNSGLSLSCQAMMNASRS
jgi:hypothetical protein